MRSWSSGCSKAAANPARKQTQAAMGRAAQVNIAVSFTMLRTGIVVDSNPVQDAEAGQ